MTRLEHAALTHEGRVRTNNEDAYCERPADGLFVVADGMGGHEHGEWASAIIAETLAAVALPTGFDGASLAVAAALHRANAVIFAEAQARGVQMGSTAVALLVRDARFAVLWVGDSRAYLYRDGRLVRLSHDHTQVQELIDRGLLSPDDADGHPMSHVLARAMGVREVVEVDVIADGIDVAIRVRFPPLEETELIMRRLDDSSQCLVAHPGLLQAPLDLPAELSGVPSLGSTHLRARHHWELYDGAGRVETVRYAPRLVTDDMSALREAALAGLGVVQLPTLFVYEDCRAGRLAQVIPDWRPRSGIVHAVFSSRRGLLPSVRALLDFLARECAAYRASMGSFS